jgi:hypothetical protein
MIPASRHVETSDNYEAWLAARSRGVTATEVARAAASDNALIQARRERFNPTPVEVNAYMRFGSEWEDTIARSLKESDGLLPNHWLIHAPGVPEHMATPDCIAPNLGEVPLIGEIKTGGKVPLDKNGNLKPPLAHVRQMQWQMYCVGAELVESCVYAFMLRVESGGQLLPGWMEPMTCVVERDDKMIADLIRVADQLLTDFENWVD